MTDQELITAVLESLGWICKPHNGWYDYENFYVGQAPKLLNSRDACCELFVKDAPNEFWDILYVMVNGTKDWTMKGVISICKATPRQLCEAWLEWKKGQKP